MTEATAEVARQPSWWPLIALGYGVGAAAGLAGHLAGLGRWDLVPIGSGVGGGVGSAVAWLWAASRRRRA